MDEAQCFLKKSKWIENSIFIMKVNYMKVLLALLWYRGVVLPCALGFSKKLFIKFLDLYGASATTGPVSWSSGLICHRHIETEVIATTTYYMMCAFNFTFIIEMMGRLTFKMLYHVICE